jgi:hypothetical protein
MVLFESGVAVPAATVWDRATARYRDRSPVEAELQRWLRTGWAQLRVVPAASADSPSVVELTFHLGFLNVGMDGVNPNQLREPGWNWAPMRLAIVQPPYSFTLNYETKVWSAARLPGYDQVWEPLVRASEVWHNARAGVAAEAVRRREEAAQRQREETDRRQREDRERLVNERREQQQQQDRDRGARLRNAPNDATAADRAWYRATFGVDLDKSAAAAAAAMELEAHERLLNEKLSRPLEHSRARSVELKYPAMAKVRDHITGTLDVMFERIVASYRHEGQDPVADATHLQFKIKTKLEIIENVWVTLRASTTPSAAKKAMGAGRASEERAAINWTLLFARRSEARRVVNAALEQEAQYAEHQGGGQVQVRSDNTLNVALNALWESLGAVRQDAVRQAGVRQPPPAAQLAVVPVYQNAIDGEDDGSDEEDEDEEEDDTSEEEEDESDVEHVLDESDSDSDEESEYSEHSEGSESKASESSDDEAR